MQDELKNVIYQAMNNSSEVKPEQSEGIEELSDEELETVAGGICLLWTTPIVCLRYTQFRNANKLV
ncbi:bacteriocin [Scytonema tolypothrichoides VB-61278]|nr:bacteriocin [Scytonema tolypothrichoides VB-61278]